RGKSDVLVRQLQGEIWRIVLAGQPLIDQRVERVTPAGRSPPQRLPQRQRLDAGLDAHGEGFRQRANDGVAGHVMHELGDGGRADRPDVARLIADRVEYWLVPIDRRLVAADPDRELARGRALRPT